LEGLIIYSPDGYMSGQLMKPGRPAYASGDMDRGTTEERAAAASGYLAYSGPFDVDEEAATLRHHMSVSLFPNWIGDTQERFVELDGDTLTISTAPVIVQGIELTPRLIWKRATPNPG
jgi:Lipocalin-like domain